MSNYLSNKDDLTNPQFCIIAATIFSLALGGTTEFAAEAVVAGLVTLIILVVPPQRSPGLFPSILFAAAMALSLTAFLPADWFPSPPWRQHLANDLHLALPPTRTPQPWITAQACGMFLFGLAWAGYLFSQKWSPGQRLQATYLIVLCVAVLATVTVVAYVRGIHVPGWKQEENRGWFPNRNQTSDVLALGGILNYALVIDCLRKRSTAGYFWLALLAPICAALVVCYSRAGILLFFAGISLWQLWPSPTQKSKKWTTLSFTLIFTLLTLFFLFGGDTLNRFKNHSGANAPVSSEFVNDLRIPLQRDAFRFSLQSPILGIGLGNFENLFASARQNSVSQSRAIHPESDWLWAACEMGWPAPLLFLAGIGWWLHKCFPFEVKRGESLRRVMAIAVVMFILHGFVDVSGHRVGSMWFALLLASLTLPTPPESKEDFDPVSPWHPVPLAFRGLGVLLLLVVAWWFTSLSGTSGSTSDIDRFAARFKDFDPNRMVQSQFSFSYGDQVPPTTAELARLEDTITNMIAEKQLDYVKQLSTAALLIAPLDWTYYFHRAYAEVFLPGQLSQAVADFQVARALQPNWSPLCMDEGTIWLSANQPDECMDAWQEALRRDPEKRSENYINMMREAAANPLVREDLGDLAAGNPDYLVLFLGEATADETKKCVHRLLTADPSLQSLNSAQRATVFASWWQKGDQADLIAQLLKNPAWLNEGWPWLAESYAHQADFQNAWETVASHAKPPAIPVAQSDQPIPDLEREFYGRPDNTAIGIMLALAEIKQGKTDDALSAIRALEKIPDHPAYVFYLEAQLWADKQQWELAWNAWRQFDGR